MTYFILFFGILLTFIAALIKHNKTYIPKTETCPGDIKDAEANKRTMKTFFILGPVLLVIGIVLLILGIGIAI